MDCHSCAIARPGDTVILNYPGRHIDQEMAQAIKGRAKARLPEGVEVLIVSDGIVTIARGDITDAPLDVTPPEYDSFLRSG